MPPKPKVKPAATAEMQDMAISIDDSDASDEELTNYLFFGEYERVLDDPEIANNPPEEQGQDPRSMHKKHKKNKLKKKYHNMGEKHIESVDTLMTLTDQKEQNAEKCLVKEKDRKSMEGKATVAAMPTFRAFPGKEISQPLLSKFQNGTAKKLSAKARAKSGKKIARVAEDIAKVAHEPPPIEREWLEVRNFRPISPIKDLEFMGQPSSEDIWSSYKPMKNNAFAGETRCPKSTEGIVQLWKASEQERGSARADTNPKLQLDELDELKVAEYWLMSELHAKDEACEDEAVEDECKKDCMDLNNLELSLDEERELAEWIDSEKLNKPLSDIEEFNVLLKLTRNLEQNGELLREMLKPKLCAPKAVETFQQQQKPPIQPVLGSIGKQSKPLECYVLPNEQVQAPVEQLATQTATIVVQQQEYKGDAVDVSKDNAQIETDPDADVIMADESRKAAATSGAANDSAITKWLQQCESAISQQLQAQWQQMISPETPAASQNAAALAPAPVTSASTSAPASDAAPNQSVDFEHEITILGVQEGGTPHTQVPADTQWQISYKCMLNKFDDVVESNMSQFHDPEAKRLSRKQRNSSNQKRTLLMPLLPVHVNRLHQIRVLQPTRRKVERETLHIEIIVVRMYCTFEINRQLDLQVLVKRLDNAVYNSEIDVIEERLEGLQIAWIWQNGSIMIINGRSQAMLSETAKILTARILGLQSLKYVHVHNLLYSRLLSWSNYPWRISMDKFSEVYALSTSPHQGSSRYIFFVDKNFPNVAARVYETGMVHVFATSTMDTDKMLIKLFPITANYHMPDLKADEYSRNNQNEQSTEKYQIGPK